MNYSTLTPAQQTQCEYLFADATFGTDPHAYDYEIKGVDVVGRVQLRAISSKLLAHARKPHTVSVNVAVLNVPDGFVTVEMSRNAMIAIQDIARSAVERMLQVQHQEA